MGVPPAAVRGFVPDEVLDEVQEPPREAATCGTSPRRPRAATVSTRSS